MIELICTEAFFYAVLVGAGLYLGKCLMAVTCALPLGIFCALFGYQSENDKLLALQTTQITTLQQIAHILEEIKNKNLSGNLHSTENEVRISIIPHLLF